MKRASQRPTLELLEERRLLATCHVVRLGDFGAGGDLGGGHSRGDLRFCINKSNSEPGPDVIDINVNGTISLTGPLPVLASDMEIQGPGVGLLTLNANAVTRAFTVASGADVEIFGLTMTGGKPPDLAGGAILNAGTLVLRAVRITGNQAFNSLNWTWNTYGGGIANNGNLTVIDSSIDNNFTAAEDNEALGGGIYNSASGTLSVYSSTIGSNVAGDNFFCCDGYGGAIYNAGSAVVFNSTIVANEAKNLGGGIFVRPGTDTFTLISHSTVAGNRGGGIYCLGGDDVYLRNTIVAMNVQGDVRGVVISGGYNLIGNSNGASGFADTDILNVDPMLDQIKDNGGPTLTVALLPGSPAIDAGDNADAPEWDQRGPGYPRIVNGRIDIGAFEVQATGAPPSLDLTALITAVKVKRRK
jgi:hypothetical protein